MKITEVTPIAGFIVETDEPYWNTYRRGFHGGWQQLMGESWESVYTDEDKLEKLYQEFIKA